MSLYENLPNYQLLHNYHLLEVERIYNDRYRYKLLRRFEYHLGILKFAEYSGRFLEYKKGWLILKPGYCWDGASGPTINTKSLILPSLIHDACYQLIRERYFSKLLRRKVDEKFKKLYLEEAKGILKPLFWLRAHWLYLGTRIGGFFYV